MNKKIQNMHAGLGPNDLKQRYIRAVEEGIEPEKTHARLGQEDTLEAFEYLPDELHPHDANYGSLDDYLPFELVDAILTSTKLGELSAQPRLCDLKLEVAGPEQALIEESSVLAYPNDLIDSLFLHLEDVVSNPSRSFANIGIDKQILTLIATKIFELALAQHKSSEDFQAEKPVPRWINRLADLSAWDHNHLQALLCVLLFYPFRLQDVESWNPSLEVVWDMSIPAVVGDLANCLYGKYPIPPFMENAFGNLSLSADRDSFLPDITQIVVYILFARGVRLGKVSSLGWLQINPAMARQLFSVPKETSFRNGLVWARLRGMGIHERVCSWLADDGFYKWSGNDAYHSISPGWLDAAQWFNKNHDEIREVIASRILEWFAHEAIEWLRITGNSDLSQFQFILFEKRSFSTVMEQVENYETAIRKRPSGPNLRWSSKGWDHAISIGSRRFKFSELLSSNELSSEGKAMSHCLGVGGYDIACKKEEIAIFSVRVGKKRVATIEIQTKTKRIRQAFGQSNSKLEPLTYQAVNEWRDWVCSRNQVCDS